MSRIVFLNVSGDELKKVSDAISIVVEYLEKEGEVTFNNNGIESELIMRHANT